MTEAAAHAPESLAQHAAFVRSVARAVLGRDDLVEDVVQQTWVVALENGARRHGPLAPWLAGVARRTAWSLRRRRARARRRDSDSPRTEAEASTVDLAARAELGRLVVEAVLALDEPYREVVLLRYYDGVGVREIGRRLALPYETARTRLKRGLASLRRSLAREEDGARREWRTVLVPLVSGPREPHLGPSSLLALTVGGLGMKKLAVALVAIGLLCVSALVLRPWETERDVHGDPNAHTVASATGDSGGKETADAAHLAGRAAAASPASAAALPDRVDFDAVDRKRDLHGRVLDEDGDGLGGARVHIVRHPWRDSTLILEPELYLEAVEGPSTTAAADGSFSFRLEPGDFVYLRAEAKGYAPVERVRLHAGERADIRMSRGVDLVVNVKTAAGEAAEDVRVWVFSVKDQSEVSFQLWGASDAEGRALFEGLAPGTPVCVIPFPQAEGQSAPAWPAFKLPPAGTHEIDVVLQDGWVLEGRVTDLESGRPIPGARVAAMWNFAGAVEADEDGRYALPGMDGLRRTAVFCTAPGHARAVAPVGNERSIDFALDRGLTADGRVVDTSGNAVSGALVRAMAGRQYSRVTDVSLAADRTDADGRFRLPGLARDLTHTVVLKTGRHAKTFVDFDPPEAGDRVELGDIVLEAPCRIDGRVVDEEGAPIRRAIVTAHGWNTDRGARRGPDSRVASTYYGALESRQTDDLGRFHFTGLAPGEYKVALGTLRDEKASLTTVVSPDAPASDVTLRLRAERSVRVVVRGPDHEPVPDVLVAVYDGNRRLAEAETDADGVALVVAPERPTDLWVIPGTEASYVSHGPNPLAADAEEVTLVLEPSTIVMGRLVGPDGKGLGLAFVALDRDGEVLKEHQTDGDGRFAFRIGPGGPVDLAFDGRFQSETRYGRGYGLPLAARAVDVPPDKRDVLLRAEAVPLDRSITVLVLDPTGRPIPDVEVVPWPQMKDASVRATTDPEGRATLRDLPPLRLRYYSTWSPTAERPWLPPPNPLAVPAGQEIVMRMREGARIEGVVTVAAGIDPKKVVVAAEGKQATRRSGWTYADATGAFVLFVDPEGGPYTVRASWYDGHAKRHEAAARGVAAGQSGLELHVGEKER